MVGSSAHTIAWGSNTTRLPASWMRNVDRVLASVVVFHGALGDIPAHLADGAPYGMLLR